MKIGCIVLKVETRAPCDGARSGDAYTCSWQHHLATIHIEYLFSLCWIGSTFRRFLLYLPLHPCHLAPPASSTCPLPTPLHLHHHLGHTIMPIHAANITYVQCNLHVWQKRNLRKKWFSKNRFKEGSNSGKTGLWNKD
jgi:hypothetical protein